MHTCRLHVKGTITVRYTGAAGVKITFSLKCLCNFWRTLETLLMLLNCEINILLGWSIIYQNSQ